MFSNIKITLVINIDRIGDDEQAKPKEYKQNGEEKKLLPINENLRNLDNSFIT